MATSTSLTDAVICESEMDVPVVQEEGNLFSRGAMSLLDFVLIKRIYLRLVDNATVPDVDVEYRLLKYVTENIAIMHRDDAVAKSSGPVAQGEFCNYNGYGIDNRFPPILVPYFTMHAIHLRMDGYDIFATYFTPNGATNDAIYASIFRNPERTLTPWLSMIFDDHGKYANWTLYEQFTPHLMREMLDEPTKPFAPIAIDYATMARVRHTGISVHQLQELCRMIDLAEDSNSYAMHLNHSKVYEIYGYYYDYYATTNDDLVSPWTDTITTYKRHVPHGAILLTDLATYDTAILKTLIWLVMYGSRHPTAKCTIVLTSADAHALQGWRQQMARLFDADFVQQFIDRIGKIRWCTYAELANIQRGARDILIIDRFEWYMTPERIVDLVEYNMLHVCDTPFKLVMMDTTVATATRISIKYTVDLALGGDSIVNPLIAGTKHGRQQMRNLYIV